METIHDYLGYVMLGFLGLFALFIVVNFLFGLGAGGKRATLRLVTLIISLPIALLLTPLIAKMLLNVSFPVIGTPEEFVGEYLFEEGDGAEMLGYAPGIDEFTYSMLIAIVGVILWPIMYFLFKFVSWIIYKIIAVNAVPKRIDSEKAARDGREFSPDDVDGKGRIKTKQHRLLGGLVGAVIGVVLFAFALIPVFGIMQGLDEIAKHKINFGGYTQENRRVLADNGGTTGDLIEIHDNIIKTNDEIQDSVIGKITKYTGIQFLGKVGTQYLMKVNKKVNLRDDLVTLGKTAGDGMAVAIEFTRDDAVDEDGTFDRIKKWSAEDYKTLRNMVDRIFNIGTVQQGFKYLVGEEELNEGLLGYLQAEKTLDDTLEGINEDPEFVAAGYDSLRTFADYKKLRDDVNNLISLMEILCVKDSDGRGLYEYFDDALTNFGEENFDANVDALLNKLGANETGDAKNAGMKKLTDVFFDFNLVNALFEGSDLSALYSAPLSEALDIDVDRRADLVIDSLDDVRNDMPELLVGLIETMKMANTITNGEGETQDNIVDALNGIAEGQGIVSVLDILTNSEGMGVFTRTILLNFIEDKIDLGDPNGNAMEKALDGAMKNITSRLEQKPTIVVDSEIIENPEWEIRWFDLLEAVRDAANIFVGIDDIDFDNPESREEIVGKMQDLLEKASESQVVAEIVVELIDGMVDESTEGKVKINIPTDSATDVMGALTGASDAIVNLLDENSDTSMEDPVEMLEILGGAEVLASLEQAGVTIDVSGLVNDQENEVTDEQITNAIDDLISDPKNDEIIAGLVGEENPYADEEELRDALKRMFGY